MKTLTITSFNFYNLSAAAILSDQLSSDSVLVQSYNLNDTTNGKMSLSDFCVGHFGITVDSPLGCFLFRQFDMPTDLPYALDCFNQYNTAGVNNVSVFKDSLVLALPYITVSK